MMHPHPPHHHHDDGLEQNKIIVKESNNEKNNHWEEHLISWLEKFHEWRSPDEDDDHRDEKEETRQQSEEEDSNNTSTPKTSTTTGTIIRLLKRLKSWRTDSTSSAQKAMWVAGVWTVLMLAGYQKKKMAMALKNTTNNNNNNTNHNEPRASTYHSATEAPLSLLYQKAKDGEVQRALLSSSGVVFYMLGKNIWKRSNLPPHLSSRDLIDTLTATCNDVSALPESLLTRLGTPVLAALPFVYLYFLYRMLQNTMGHGSDMSRSVLRSHSTTTLDDVAGLEDVIWDISEIVSYLQNPTHYRQIGAKPPRGVLLFGPPGGGKTLLAQAVAGQANVDCFLACSASDFVEIYVGRGAARVRSLFAQAKQQAVQNWRKRKGQSSTRQWQSWLLGWDSSINNSNSSSYDDIDDRPSAILFIDELDALGKARGNSSLTSNDEREQTLNQLLIELDGFASGSSSSSSAEPKGEGDHDASNNNKNEDDENNVTVIVMAASNRADVLDPALLRRFDRQIYIGYPGEKGRRDILKLHARRVACDVIDWTRLASESRTGGCSGADLRNLVNDAALLAVRDGSGVVQQSHLEHAARRLQQMKDSHNKSSHAGFNKSNERNQYNMGPLGIR